MGKSDNIKRAKKLKNAKRQREKDAMTAAGIAKPSIKLQEKITKDGNLTLINNSKSKFSDLLLDFISPILSENDDFEVVESKIFFGIQIWNAAVVREKSEVEYEKLKKAFLDFCVGLPNAEYMFDEMVERKKSEFKEFNILYNEFDFKLLKNNDCNLTVAVLFYE